MAEQLVVDVGDDGSIGKLPEPLQKFLDKRIDEAFKKGAEKTEGKLTPYLSDPVEMERLRQRDKALAEIEAKEAERAKEYEKAAKLRDEAHAKEKDHAVKEEQKRTKAAIEKVRASLGKTIRAAASAHGARAESLDELERLLGAEVDLDDELNEYVRDAKDPKSKRLTDKGEPVTIEGLVADYLKTHPHHVAAPSVKGGKAPGGVTLAGRPQVPSDARGEARARVAENPSDRNIGALLTTALRTPAA
jgi:hypothetical protein